MTKPRAPSPFLNESCLVSWGLGHNTKNEAIVLQSNVLDPWLYYSLA